MKKYIAGLLIMGWVVLMSTPAAADSVRLLSANIGNSDLLCMGYDWKLCLSSVEHRLTDSIRALEPDVVLLQEVYSAEACMNQKKERGPRFVCYNFDKLSDSEKEQSRRILGPDYTIVVTREAYEAVAVKVGVGHIKDCADGQTCYADRAPLPAGCDPGFSVTPLDVEIQGKQVRLVNGHPDSLNVACRAHEVETAFQNVVSGLTLMAGDWNLDPFRNKDISVAVWKDGLAKFGFQYHSDVAVRNPPYHTIFIPILEIPYKSLDHVISDFAKGTCEVLGVSPNTKRLDHGFDCDHRGILCHLEF